MKAKLILIGGCISWLVLLAGVGTLEFGEGDGCHELLGILLCFVGGILQLLFCNIKRSLANWLTGGSNGLMNISSVFLKTIISSAFLPETLTFPPR